MRSKVINKRSPRALKPAYMKSMLHFFSWNRCLRLSIGVLAILIVLNFYGLYTNKFYFFKIDNYIFPLLTIVHFTFLYVVQFKMKEQEFTDPPMRNLEYALYAILPVYVFKVLDTVYILLSYGDYENHLMPGTFVPIGIVILVLQLLLVFLTLITFKVRKDKIGKYNFDSINENIDSWQ